MKDLLRRPQLRELAAVVILYFLLGVIVDNVLYAVLGEEVFESHFLLCVSARDLIQFLAMYFGLYYRKNRYWMPLSERESIFKGKTVITIFLIAFLMFGLNILVTIFVAFFDLPIVQETEDIVYAQSLPLQILATVITAPLLEETMCRGVIQGSFYGLLPDTMDEKNRAAIAVVFSAIIFAAFHAGWIAKAFACLGGLVFGFLMNRFRDLRVTMAAHAAANLFAIIIQNGLLG